MTILRAIAAVIAGYLAYAVGSMLIVGVVVSSPGTATMIVALTALLLIGAVAGFLAARLGGEKGRLAVWIAAGLVLLATAANLALGLGAEPLWYKVATLVLTVPALVVIGQRFSTSA